MIGFEEPSVLQIARALAYLSDPHRDPSEPYTLAQFAIAAAELGDQLRASDSVANLIQTVTPEPRRHVLGAGT
ncbi:MAG TPA: hypothetical protein VIW68_10050 [Candidatus Sulfotelmatobacter sp.]